MQFIRTSDILTAATVLEQRLITELTAGKKVLWLVSGGSNIGASVSVMANIPSDLQPQLTIMLIDERFGAIGHPNSNFEQLMQAGFNEGEATLIPVLRLDLTLEQTAEAYNEVIELEFGKADIIISQLGIGADGHISGILPDSPASIIANQLVTAYTSEPYQRITTTFSALQAITADYSFVFGADKKAALQDLQTDLSLTAQPSQILKQIPEAYIYNDQLGDTL
jgi:6-phosphogluconolactonase/glucosamine-6-phosphate isomerase/deaminase